MGQCVKNCIGDEKQCGTRCYDPEYMACMDNLSLCSKDKLCSSGSICCGMDEKCDGDECVQKCPADQAVCGSTCCPKGQTCIFGECCDTGDAHGGMCCNPPERRCAHDVCCPKGQVCDQNGECKIACGTSALCDATTQICDNGTCVDMKCVWDEQTFDPTEIGGLPVCRNDNGELFYCDNGDAGNWSRTTQIKASPTSLMACSDEDCRRKLDQIGLQSSQFLKGDPTYDKTTGICKGVIDCSRSLPFCDPKAHVEECKVLPSKCQDSRQQQFIEHNPTQVGKENGRICRPEDGGYNDGTCTFFSCNTNTKKCEPSKTGSFRRIVDCQTGSDCKCFTELNDQRGHAFMFNKCTAGDTQYAPQGWKWGTANRKNQGYGTYRDKFSVERTLPTEVKCKGDCVRLSQREGTGVDHLGNVPVVCAYGPDGPSNPSSDEECVPWITYKNERMLQWDDLREDDNDKAEMCAGSSSFQYNIVSDQWVLKKEPYFTYKFPPCTGLQSPNKKYLLAFQSDGNLVLYQANGSAMASTDTAIPYFGNAAMELRFNLDGIQIFKNGKKVWMSHADRNVLADKLILQDNGDLVMKDRKGVPMWHTGAVSDGPSSFPGKKVDY